MEEDFLALLAAVPPITDQIGGAADPRIGWGRRPPGEPTPAIALHLVSAPFEQALDGPVGATGYLVQADCWGPTYDAAKLLARAVLAAVASPAFTAEPFQGVFPQNAADDDEPADGPDAASGSVTLFRTKLDLRVWHNS